jgi:PKD repeat protein
MKIFQTLKILSATLGLTLMCSASMAITIQTNSWTNTFPIGTNTTYFTGGTMVGTAWWFGSWPLCNNPMTNDPSKDAQGNSSSGSLYVSIPWTGTGQQGWFFSTFDDAWGWNDGGVQIPLKDIKQLAFDIYISSATPKDSSGNYGDIEANLIMGTAAGGFYASPIVANFEELTIPSAAGGAWLHMYDSNTLTDVAAAITAGYTNAAAIAFYIDNNVWGGYPTNGTTYTFWMDNLAVTTGTNSSAPVAQFLMNSNIGVAPFTVTFQDTSLNTPTSWSWNFGDGGTSTLQFPTHTFTNMWRQLVTLKASNAFGNSSATQAVYQCFPCDALYDWRGSNGQVATKTSLSNSLVAGGNTIGTFSTTNHDTPSTNLLGIAFTNITGLTNGCPVVFSNGTIYSNLNTTNALVYNFTNDHEQFDFIFNSTPHVTNFVWLFYDTMPYATNAYGAADEVGISSVEDNYDIGAFWFNRGIGVPGPLLPGNQNEYRTDEADSGYSDSPKIWELPNRLYRLLFQMNTNGASEWAICDTVSNTLVGFVTNMGSNRVNIDIGGFCNGHVSQEIFVTNVVCIMGYHDIFSINRPLSFTQMTNVVLFGP